MNCPFYHYILSIFISCYLFWLYFIWYEYGYTCLHLASICLEYHFTSLPFGLCLSLELRCVFWRQQIVGSCFLIHPATVCHLVNSIYLYLGWLLIDEDLILPFYLLFSGSSISPLFLFPFVSVCHFGLMVFCDIFLSFFFVCVCLYFMFIFVVTLRFV